MIDDYLKRLEEYNRKMDAFISKLDKHINDSKRIRENDECNQQLNKE